MNAFYTILYVSIRFEIDEKISIGLMCITDKDVFFSISKTKLSAVEMLVPKHRYEAINEQLEGIQEWYLKTKEEKRSSLASTPKSQSIFTESYINYLNAYKNNLVLFSKTSKINLYIDENMFNKLYNKYIDDKSNANANVLKNMNITL